MIAQDLYNRQYEIEVLDIINIISISPLKVSKRYSVLFGRRDILQVIVVVNTYYYYYQDKTTIYNTKAFLVNKSISILVKSRNPD